MFSELRLTIRALGKSPAFVAIAVFTLALGIGVNAAMFGLINALMLRGLPFPRQERLYSIAGLQRKTGERWDVSGPDFLDLRAQQHAFEDLAAYRAQAFNISSPGADAERVNGCAISVSGPTLLRVGTTLGRWFQPNEDQREAAPVVVIGYAVWKNRFAGNPAIVGQPLKVNGEWATIVGVAPQSFRFPEVADAWMPLKLKADADRGDHWLAVFGRLRDGVAPQGAAAAFTGLARQLETAHPDTNKDLGIDVKIFKDEFLDDGTRRILQVMFGAVGFVLLIACANVANLLLARSAVRQKELAIRAALGATRGQIVRLLLLESFVLSIAGAVVGLPLAFGLMAALNADLRASPINMPYWMVLDIDWAGAGYVLGLAVLTCFIAGLWPAWITSRTDLNTVLKDSARGSTGFSLSKTSRVMVIAEVILSAVLLVLSALTIRSVVNAQLAPLGYRADGVFVARLALNDSAYDPPQKQIDFYRELMRRLETHNEVGGAAVASLAPTWGDRSPVTIEGQPLTDASGSDLPPQYASRSGVSGNYFALLDIPLVAGRTFDERDTLTSQHVAIVSAKFAERYWPHENPLGKRLVYGRHKQVGPTEWAEVVGVVSPTVQSYQRSMMDVPQTYVPFAQTPAGVRSLNVLVRARNAAAAGGLASLLRATVRELDTDQPLIEPQTLATMVANARFMKGLIAWIFGVFGGVALVLAAVGLYGVMSYSVSQRTQEIGVRMALGAEPGDVLGMILREGGVRLGIGLAIGLGAAYFAGQLLAFILYGVQPGDAEAFGGTLLALGLAGFVACLVPALRAVRVNPLEALRCE
jgi:putative ABC transport system permease protein